MRLSRGLLSLLVPAVLSCTSFDSPGGPGIALYLELSATTVPTSGDPINATIIARNVSTGPLTLSGPNDCLLYVEVWNSRSQRVYSSASQCAGAVIDEELGPGETKTATVTWAGTTTNGDRLPAGIYRMHPVALLPGGAYSQPGANVRVE
ncbi:MAG TPA: hypothetical protein VF178_09570 [Gemmatimonadaceae bacterium]